MSQTEKDELIQSSSQIELEFFNNELTEECIQSVYYQSNFIWNAYQNLNNHFEITYDEIKCAMNNLLNKKIISENIIDVTSNNFLSNPILTINTSSDIISSEKIQTTDNNIISFQKQTKKPKNESKKYSKKFLNSIIKKATYKYLCGNQSSYLSMSFSERCLQLKKIRDSFQPEQRTEAWYNMRNSMLTASDFSKALGSQTSINSYALSKVLPRENKSHHSSACKHGILFEPLCKMFYESLYPAEVEEFGLLQHSNYTFIGASPDGICNEKSSPDFVGRLVEFKAPYSRKLIKGVVPESYLVQIQGQLEVTNLNVCDYLECDFELLDVNPDENEDLEYIAKGIIIKYWEENEEKIHYGKINDLENQIPSNIVSYKVLYWILKDFNVVTVKRNLYWFNEYLLPRLTFTWNKVKWYRANPEEIKLKHKNNKVMSKPKYMFR